jgi:DNA-binding beta-propeller fold protein YncE
MVPVLASLVLLFGAATGEEGDFATTPNASKSCVSEKATAAYRRGFAAQADLKTDAALAAWKDCLAIEPTCVPCVYESGWTHWSRSEWKETVAAWEKTLELDPKHDEAPTWIRQASDRRDGKAYGILDAPIPIGTKTTSGAMTLELVAKFQNYDSTPPSSADRYDADVYSPKSARYSADGTKVWVNSLRGARTVVYDAATLTKKGTIDHVFGAAQAPLFKGKIGPFPWLWNMKAPGGAQNKFRGSPVESELTHAGKYLWVPYYRRDWDKGATSPSAVAIIDAATDTIVRVMPTGPIPKYAAASPDGKWLAIVHWGDNTIGLIDTSKDDPASFEYAATLVVEKKLPLKGVGVKDRDQFCGFCLRGTVFSADSKTLFVARMGGGGIAGFDVATKKYLGTVVGMKATPRHLGLSPDGSELYLTANVSGYVSKIPTAELDAALRSAGGKRVNLAGWQEVYVGAGARTLAISPDGAHLYIAVQSSAELVVVSAKTLTIEARIRADAFPVGAAVSPDGTQVWVTSQGRSGKGGNSVCVYRVTTETAASTP